MGVRGPSWTIRRWAFWPTTSRCRERRTGGHRQEPGTGRAGTTTRAGPAPGRNAGRGGRLMTERAVTQALHRVADEVRAPTLPADLWRRGRQQRRRTAGALIAAVLAGGAVLAGVTSLPGHWPDARPAHVGASTPAVPSQMYAPLPGDRTVQEAPAGPAVLIVSGEGTLRGSDAFGGEGRTLVVSRDGRYHLVNGFVEGEVGQDFHLSPNGRYLAATGPVDGADSAAFDATSLVDLTTGRVRVYPAGTPLGWAPDSERLLLSRAKSAGSL